MIFKSLYVLVLTTNFLLTNYGRATSFEEMKSLQNMLFENYTTDLRPLKNQSEMIIVSVTVMLEGITDVDERNQVLGCNVVLQLNWKDDFLQWHPNEYGGTDTLDLSIEQIWHPKMMVTNSLGSRELVPGENHPLWLRHDGHVTWFPAAVLHTSCGLDMTWFPFDKQTCAIRLLPIRYSSAQLQIETSQTEIELLPSYMENGVWVVIDSGFDAGSKHNPILTVYLTLKRQSLFLILNIIVPIVVISFLNMAVFAVPNDSGEKLSAAITVFLSLSVFMTYVSDKMPQTSTPLSVLTIYLTFILLTSALTVLSTIWILNVHFTSNKPVPAWLKWTARLNSAKVKGSKVDVGDKESPPLEYQVTWRDVSRGLDYIFLRLFILEMGISTTAFIVKLVIANNW